MPQYAIKFVVVNQMPSTTAEADNLSILMTRQFGADGWQLVSTLNDGAGLLLSFQKETSNS